MGADMVTKPGLPKTEAQWSVFLDAVGVVVGKERVDRDRLIKRLEERIADLENKLDLAKMLAQVETQDLALGVRDAQLARLEAKLDALMETNAPALAKSVRRHSLCG
jgi:hypothetical protein